MNAEIMFDRVETARGFPLTDEEKHEIEMWGKGRALQAIVGTEGWQVVLEMLQNYAADALQRLVSTDPARKEDVLAEHAVAFAAGRICNSFVQDATAAVDASKITPASIKEGLKRSSAPPELSL